MTRSNVVYLTSNQVLVVFVYNLKKKYVLQKQKDELAL